VRLTERITTRDAAVRFIRRIETRFRVGGFDKRIESALTASMRARCASMTSRQDTARSDIRRTSS
jgi:hypothetical protein